jgi:hypothetical protein
MKETEIMFLVFVEGTVKFVSLETLMGSYAACTRTALETCLVIKQLEFWCPEYAADSAVNKFHKKLLERIAILITAEALRAKTLRKTKQLNYILFLVFNNTDMPRTALLTVHNRYVDLRGAGKQYVPLPEGKVGITQEVRRMLYRIQLPEGREVYCLA